MKFSLALLAAAAAAAVLLVSVQGTTAMRGDSAASCPRVPVSDESVVGRLRDMLRTARRLTPTSKRQQQKLLEESRKLQEALECRDKVQRLLAEGKLGRSRASTPGPQRPGSGGGSSPEGGRSRGTPSEEEEEEDV
jgi:hypothetical protein